MRVAALYDVHGNLPALEAVLADPRLAAAEVIVCGGTHVQYDRVLVGTRLLNAGSVGMPYKGRTAAFWALLGSDVQLLDTEYDVDAAVAAIRATGHPETDDIVETLLAPHSAAEANEVFEARREAASGAT